ncbi:MAG: hypothetical protein KJN93_03070 [Alphaproteobacteria bacterium]|nr:hypothetical protein [Alphaproteobacteria bacterium]
MLKKAVCLSIIALTPFAAAADPAVIEAVTVSGGGGGSYSFAVTLRHGDTGWDDYADGWRVETLDGKVLGTRTLFHPHVDEQPFTRQLGGVAIPDDLTQVQIRAKTLTEGWAGRTKIVDLK